MRNAETSLCVLHCVRADIFFSSRGSHSAPLPPKQALHAARSEISDSVVLSCKCKTPVPDEVMERYWTEVHGVYAVVRKAIKTGKGAQCSFGSSVCPVTALESTPPLSPCDLFGCARVRARLCVCAGKRKLGVVLDIDDTTLWCSCPSCCGEDTRMCGFPHQHILTSSL